MLGGALGALLQGIGVNTDGVDLRGMGGVMQQAQQGLHGDWQCPNTSCMNHSKMVFGKNASCPKCGSSKPGGGGAATLGGALGALMQGMGMNLGGAYLNGSAVTQSRGGSNPGDWPCPNTDCMNNRKLVFAKHQSCPKCGAEHQHMGYDARGADRSRSPHRSFPGMATGAEGW